MGEQVKKIDSIYVSECFYSIQGEGQTMGRPAVFLRLTGCNLLCESDGWRCDTIEVWRKGDKTLFKNVFDSTCLVALEAGAHLVITGGEPLLQQQQLKAFISWFSDAYGFLPTIEVETNGTIKPSKFMLAFVNYWNCSPKLENSGEPLQRRFKPEVIELLNLQKGTIFKFVICEKQDVDEILKWYYTRIDDDKIWLMPAGASKRELENTRQLTADACKEKAWKYSERLHIDIWDMKTGV